ncbi:hypothetical protein D9M72_179410 [compost metagenome]
MFHPQGAAPLQMAARAPHDAGQVFQAARAVGQRAARLEAHVALVQVRIVAGHIRRVGHDQIETLARGHGLVPTALDQADGRRQVPGIGGRDGQRGRADVGRHHPRIAARQGDRNRDRPAARAQVQHGGRGQAGQAFQRGLHQHLGIRPRDQHVGGHPEAVAHELAVAHQIGHGLAGQAPLGQRLVRRGHLGRERIGVMRQQPGARLAQHVLQQHAHLQPGQARIEQQRLQLRRHHGESPVRCRRPAPPIARPGARRSARRSVLPGRLP